MSLLAAALDVPWWTAAPFVVLLLAIAVLPLTVGHWWHSNLNKALVAFALGGGVAAYLWSRGEAGQEALGHALIEYFSFMVLLWSLYTISGGIVIDGDFRGRPLNNTFLLAIGACLASVLGTTGASMLLIRPLLRMNRGRKRVSHLPVFFIFCVSNTGGLLTPLGDPPLFLGYLKGVSFFWTAEHLWFEWAIVNGIILTVFLVWDAFVIRGDRALPVEVPRPFGVRGGVNFLFLAGVLAAVLVKSYLTGTEMQEYFLTEAAQIILGLASLAVTPRALRQDNRFSWAPIVEVAVLFVGIFVVMVPALKLLENHGKELGITEAWQLFWLTGGLSSFLDNAPTYVTLGTLAAGGEDFSILMRPDKEVILAAISCGAVFMGANTYIGNGPNFMVKAIAEEDGYPMPSFFGYMVYSGLILIPSFVLVTFLFFV